MAPLLGNLGLPLVCIAVPIMAVALVPIVSLEAAVYRHVCRIGYRRAWWAAWRANLFSTFLGVPVSWLLLFALRMTAVPDSQGVKYFLERPDLTPRAQLAIKSTWLFPADSSAWMISAASLLLLLPFFLASVATEWLVLHTDAMWPAPSASRVGPVLLANLASYFLMFCGYGLLFLLAQELP